ncbi:hypothetical protein [Kordia zhangzhouensis]|uniref:hypothetical protein n=1 Tax=Kordia zhangzhouensis TaxID=1620405 RepID=UPI0012E03834|nr:hypothetical protein [Kordia zhangzhouensis]
MKSYRSLIIIPLFIILLILMGITAFVMPKKEIIGTWVSEQNPDYKLEFMQNGVCRDFYANKPHKNYVYTISTQCNENSAYRSLFVKIEDEEGFFSKCYELKGVNEQNNGILVLGDTEKDEEYRYSKILDNSGL